MKIGHIFNMANNAYQLVKALRKHDVNAELVLNSNDFGMSLPLWDELNLHFDPYQMNIDEILAEHALPEWIKVWRNDKLTSPKAISELLQLTKQYDLLHLHNPAQVFLQWQKPYIVHDAGWIRTLIYRDGVQEKLARRAYANAEAIVMTNADTYPLLQRLPHKRIEFIPFVIDPDKYRPDRHSNKQLTFLHPARHYWDVKGNHKLIEAYNQFIREGYDAHLHMVNWGWLEDTAKSRLLVKGYRLNDYVTWHDPMPKPALIDAYNHADAVLDQFNLGCGGTTMYEAMSCESPVCISLDARENIRCFGEVPPALNTKTVEEIHSALCLLADNGKTRQDLGRKGRAFVLKHNHPDRIAEKMIALYESVLA